MTDSTPPESSDAAFVYKSGRSRRADIRAGIEDLLAGARAWPQWFSLGNYEMSDRYRRTLLGPLWMTLTMAATVIAIGILYSRIMSVNLSTFLPSLTAGLVCWNFITTTLQESANTYIYSEGIIRQINLPKSIYVYRVVWRNAIGTFHNALVLLCVLVWFGTPLRWTLLLALPGAILLTINVLWLSILIAMLGVRFRDVPPIIASVLQLFFFLTPIVWVPRTQALVSAMQWNPFYHALQLVRAPILGSAPSLLTWSVAIIAALAGWAATLGLFGRYRWRISYWL